MMPFPLVAEISDAVAQYLDVEIRGTNNLEDEDDNGEGFKQDLKNFRLVCRDFAAAGVRYLAPVVTIMRIPEAFEVANEIANHPVARFYVKRLICYYDRVVEKKNVSRHPSAVAMAAIRMNEFQASGEDVRNLERLIKGFPRLRQFEFRLLDLGPMDTKWHQYTMKIYDMLGFDYLLRSPALPPLDFLRLLEDSTINTLVLYRIPYIRCIRTWPACFQQLRKLKIISPFSKYIFAPSNIVDWAPLLEDLEYIGIRRPPSLYTQNDVVAGLPQTLQFLRLAHIELIEESCPSNLQVLELVDVSFELYALPPTLTKVHFQDLRLLDNKLSRWADILASLKTGCTFTISGYFKIVTSSRQLNWEDQANDEDQNSSIGYLHCRDVALNTHVGDMLGTILLLRNSPDSGTSGKEELLRLMFSDYDGLIQIVPHPFNDTHGDIYRTLGVSTSLKAKYTHDVTDSSCLDSTLIIRGPHGCCLCPFTHSYSYSGIVG